MKLSSVLLLASMATATAKTITGAKNIRKVLSNARRLDEDAEEEEEDAYLASYNLKMISCSAGTKIVDPEDGEYEYGAITVRLCPSEYGCDSDSKTGCKAGYGDYLVGINSFVDAYFEDQKDNMQWDDAFEVDRYARCEEYEMEAGDDDAAAAVSYYIGPTCDEDSLDLKLALFDDYTCTTESSTTFEEISNGWTLPFSSGGLVSTSCIDCIEVNDDGEYELREMCKQMKENAAYSCETEMEYYSYYGKNEQGCEYIEEFLPKSGGGGAFGWFVFFCIVGGFAGYVMWWRKKKSTTSDGLVA